MYKHVALALLFGIIVVGCGGNPGNNGGKSVTIDPEDAKPFTAPALSDADKTKYLNAINDARAETQDCGSAGVFDPAPALTWNDHLHAASAEHNYDMVKSGVVDKHHRGSGTQYDWTKVKQGLDHASYFNERIQNNGYTGGYPLLENLTAGIERDTPEKAVKAWLKSSGHCKNLMDPNVKEVGMAHLYEENSKYKHYWTQDFGGGN